VVNKKNMETGLTPDTEHRLLSLGQVFDGYAYARGVWHCQEEEVHPTLKKRLQHVQETGKLFLQPTDNLATNFYLHRMFHHWGWLPATKSKEWYTMLYFYLHLYRVPLSVTQQFVSESDWLRRPKGSAEAAAAEVRFVLRR
jgi:hypothetical protein